jgi:uncharacterized protein YndB with AHSA1/START domain
MTTASSDGEPDRSAAGREVVVSRSIGAPRELVFEAFTQVRHLSRWWGPEGFTTTTRSFEFRAGGSWAFVMHGPDGTDDQEWITWTEIVPPERIALVERDHPEGRGGLMAGQVFFSVTMSLDGFMAASGCSTPTSWPGPRTRRSTPRCSS